MGEDAGFELERGVLVPVMPGGREHAGICTRITALLFNYVDPRGLGEVLSDAGFVLERAPDTVRGPDVSFTRQERLGGPPEPSFVEGHPDLAVEVVSSAGSMPATLRKASEYLAAGTTLVWVVDASRRAVVTFERDGEVTTLHESDILTGGGVLPGFQIAVGDLF